MELDKYLKLEADLRLPNSQRSKEKDPLLEVLALQRKKYRDKRKLEQSKQETDKILAMKEKEKVRQRTFAKEKRKQELDTYKEKHWGLTPSQVAYRSQKQFKKGLNK